MPDNPLSRFADKLINSVHIEFKIPFVFGEIKLDATDTTKKWWAGEQKQKDIELAIKAAEINFYRENREDKVAQILHDFSFAPDAEFRKIIAGLSENLDEEKVTWLAKIKIERWWDERITENEVRNGLGLYLSYLRRELIKIKEFREMISALRLERIEENTYQTVENTEKLIKDNETIKATLDDIKQNIIPQPVTSQQKLNTGWFFGHRYGDLAAFTGRADELKMLDEWLANKTESLLIFNAFGGFGKSALTWYWLNNNVDKAAWPTVIWWSFYEKGSGFDNFLAEALTHLGMETKERSARQQVNDFLDAMQKINILIVMDGFERLLRQYARMNAALQDDEEDTQIDPSQRDCTSQPAEVFLRGLSDKNMISKILMTSRLFPLALEGKNGKLQRGCREVNLKGFSPDDAVTYFRKEGIAATRAEIIAVCSAYGYHPLSLSLLVGLINEDHEHRGDIEAVKNLEIFEDVKAKRHHVLKRAYQSLAPERRDLLSKIACFRGSMEYAVLKKVFPSLDLDKALLDLRKRGLLQYAGETQRYDIHPIVRHYAYDHFTDEQRRKEAHVGLVGHFRDTMPLTNTKVKTLEDLTPVIELYHHMVGAEQYNEAFVLYSQRLRGPLYYHLGAYDLDLELLLAMQRSVSGAPRLSSSHDQAWNLYYAVMSYERIGRLQSATDFVHQVIDLDQKTKYEHNLGSAHKPWQ